MPPHLHLTSIPRASSTAVRAVLPWCVSLGLALSCTSNRPAPGDASTRETDVRGDQSVDSSVVRYFVDGVTLRAMSRPDPSEPQTVEVDQGTIASIRPSADVRLAGSDRVVDGRGLFLMPGLADMHSHAATRPELARYLAHGVTTLRIMHGFDAHLTIRDAVESGREVGPSLVVASPIIDGEPVATPEYVSVRGAEEAAQRVEAFVAAGYDQIKLYHNLDREAFLSAVRTAHRLGERAVGHVPIAVGAQEAFGAGMDSSEHFTGMLQALQTQSPALGAGQSTEWSLVMSQGAEASRAGELARAAKAGGTWLVPTLRMHQVLQAPPAEWTRWSSDPRVEQVSPGARQRWQLEIEGRRHVEPSLYESAQDGWDHLCAIARAAHEEGAQLLVGTDYGMPYLFPGASVHEEIAAFVECGLPLEDVLRAATVKAAEFLGKAGDFGSVEVGARADLLLLDTDPLESPPSSSHVRGVSVRGHWFHRGDVDVMLAEGRIPSAVPTPPREVCRVRASGGPLLIDDFDDDDPVITGDGRAGLWYAFDDGTGGSQSPSGDGWLPEPGGVGNGGGAAHVRGQGFTSWGAGIGVSLRWDIGRGQACGYDASAYDGVQFWARGTVMSFAVALSELDVVPVEEGGRCTSSCYGAHRAAVQLGACWQHYVVRFDSLVAPSWGGQTGPVDATEITAVQFYADGSPRGEAFDYWIDELAFFRGEPPAHEPICDAATGDAGTDG